MQLLRLEVGLNYRWSMMGLVDSERQQREKTLDTDRSDWLFFLGQNFLSPKIAKIYCCRPSVPIKAGGAQPMRQGCVQFRGYPLGDKGGVRGVG